MEAASRSLRMGLVMSKNWHLTNKEICSALIMTRISQENENATFTSFQEWRRGGDAIINTVETGSIRGRTKGYGKPIIQVNRLTSFRR